MMDDLDVAAQPHCPVCMVVMRTVGMVDVCPSCGVRVVVPGGRVPVVEDSRIIDFPGR